MYSFTLLIAALLSVSHWNSHLWRSPQCLASMFASRSGAVKPPSSLRVELPTSYGPSIGPEPWNSTLLSREVTIFHPNVPNPLESPPSDAISIDWDLDLKARQTVMSFVIC